MRPTLYQHPTYFTKIHSRTGAFKLIFFLLYLIVWTHNPSCALNANCAVVQITNERVVSPSYPTNDMLRILEPKKNITVPLPYYRFISRKIAQGCVGGTNRHPYGKYHSFSYGLPSQSFVFPRDYGLAARVSIWSGPVRKLR